MRISTFTSGIAANRASLVRKAPAPALIAVASCTASGVRSVWVARRRGFFGDGNGYRLYSDALIVQEQRTVLRRECGITMAQRLSEDFDECHGGRDYVQIATGTRIEKRINQG